MSNAPLITSLYWFFISQHGYQIKSLCTKVSMIIIECEIVTKAVVSISIFEANSFAYIYLLFDRSVSFSKQKRVSSDFLETRIMSITGNSWDKGQKKNRISISSFASRVQSYRFCWTSKNCTVKPVYNDHLMGYFPAFWSSSRWPLAT